MAVPFMDLRSQYLKLKPEMDAAIQAVIDKTAFVGGAAVAEFEREFAIHCDTRACVGTSNGTDAIALALQALGVRPGDEVITVPNTFIATAEAITMVGATPRFCDVEADTHLMDPDAFEAAITDRTRAVIPVHLFGQTCDMDRIRGIADAHGILIIEDAAQAHGATCRGRRAGSMGHAACFSFYPGKNLGAYGDGGAVTSGDLDLIERVRCLANHGRASHTDHALAGRNCRLDGIQAAVLRVKLPHLDAWNQARRDAAARYDEMLADIDAIRPVRVAEGMESVHHLYVIQVPDRDGLRSHLQENDIGCGLHYRLPIHLTEAYQDLGIARGTFPVAESLQEHIISLPMFPEITPEMQSEVVACVRRFVEVGAGT